MSNTYDKKMYLQSITMIIVFYFFVIQFVHLIIMYGVIYLFIYTFQCTTKSNRGLNILI